jgi:hypothetical protein
MITFEKAWQTAYEKGLVHPDDKSVALAFWNLAYSSALLQGANACAELSSLARKANNEQQCIGATLCVQLLYEMERKCTG